MRGMPLLFCLVLFTLNYCSHGDLIADTCTKTEYPNLCISTLRSNPDSKTAEVKGLVRIILEVALVRANATLNLVNDLLKKKKDPVLKQGLTICASLYGEAVNNDIPEAIRSVGTFEARFETDGVVVVADDCEESLSDGIKRKSPITVENNIIKQLALIALAIINRLG